MKRFADVVMAKGYKLVSDGTDNHLVLIDLKPQGVRTMEPASRLPALSLRLPV